MDLTEKQTIKYELQQIQHKKMLVERALMSLQKPPPGTLNFSQRRMKRECSELQEKITRLSALIRPDIIA